MTFNPVDHPRASDGTFSEKVGSAAEVSLTAGSQPDFEKLAARLTRAGERSGEKRYDVTDGDIALVEEVHEALKDPRASERLFEAAAVFSDRLDDANFHSASIAIDAAIGESMHRLDPDRPVHNPSSVMRVSADMNLVRLAAKQTYDRTRDAYAESQNETTAQEWAYERIDGSLVHNPNLDEALARELHGRVTGWRRNELLANPSLPADLR